MATRRMRRRVDDDACWNAATAPSVTPDLFRGPLRGKRGGRGSGDGGASGDADQWPSVVADAGAGSERRAVGARGWVDPGTRPG